MAVGRVAVAGFLEAAEELAAEQVALGMRVELDEESRKLGADGEVAHREAVCGEFVAQLVEPFGLGVVVDTIERGEAVGAGELGDGLVGREHEFFD